MVGKSLSHYKILEELGRGGMGIVYKGEDTKLHRTVAIKVLPAAALSSDNDRARFYREARAAASLSHPNIATVYEIDEAIPEGSNTDDVRPFIAMEFIEGHTLEDRIKQGPMKLEEAVRIAGEITSALEAAHENYIVHRDIKAANVMLTAKGSAKVLDFGLALTAQSTKLTRMGSTLGTVAYMSPEQARGEEVDSRTDIWALGVTLYEMIAGRPPFGGDYEQAVVYSIMNEDPEPLTAVRTGVPMGIEWIVSKCLAKKAADRYQTATDLLVDLRNVDLTTSGMSRTSEASSRLLSAPMTAATAPMRSRPSLLESAVAAWPVLGIAVVISLRLGYLAFSESPIPLETSRYSIVLSPNGPVAEWFTYRLASSPDGRYIAYMGEDERIYLQERNERSALAVTPETDQATSPFFSPDSQELGYFDATSGQLKRIPLPGGSPQTIATLGGSCCLGITWGAYGNIVYAGFNTGLVEQPVDGGKSRAITVPDSLNKERTHRFPRFIAETNDLLFTIGKNSDISWDEGDVGLYSDVSESYKTILEGGRDASYTSTGHLIYGKGGSLFAAQFDFKTGDVGNPVSVKRNVSMSKIFGKIDYSLDNTGRLVYLEGDQREEHTSLVWLDRTGSIISIEDSSAVFRKATISADASKLLLSMGGANDQVWIRDLTSGIKEPFTTVDNNISPVWSPNGDYIAYYSSREGGGIFIQSENKASSAAKVASIAEIASSMSWSGSEDVMAFSNRENDGFFRIRLLDLKTSEVKPFTSAGANSRFSMISPDGRWIAFQSDESGQPEIYIQALSDLSIKERVSVAGGTRPVWHNNGRELFYLSDTRMMSALFNPEEANRLERRALFDLATFDPDVFDIEAPDFSYDYDEKKDQFLFLVGNYSDPVDRIDVVVNWFEELKQLVPASER